MAKSSEDSTLKFISKPNIEFITDSQTVNIDQEYSSGNNKCDVRWYLNDQLLTVDDKRKMKAKNNVAQLKIKNATSKDSGNYRIELIDRNTEKSIKKKFKLNLKAERLKGAPLYVVPPGECWLDGTRLGLRFNIRSNHELTAVWTRENKEIENSGKFEIILKDLGEDEHLVELIIAYPDENDVGIYECLVKNAYGQLKTVFNVEGKTAKNAPIFLKKPRVYEKVENNKHVTVFEAVFKGKDDSPRIVWFNPKGQILESNPRQKIITKPGTEPSSFIASLEITDYKSEDNGMFSCQCRNRTGKDAAVAEFLLNIEINSNKNGKK